LKIAPTIQNWSVRFNSSYIISYMDFFYCLEIIKTFKSQLHGSVSLGLAYFTCAFSLLILKITVLDMKSLE